MEFTSNGRRLQDGNETATMNMSSSEDCMAIWMDYVTQSMENEVATVIPLFETLSVETFNVSRDSFADVQATAFFYDVRIDIRSAIIVHNLRRYIGGPFDSREERATLVEAMRSSGCPEYESFRDVTLMLPVDDPNIPGLTDSPSNDSAKTGVIAGSVAAIAAAAMLVGIFIFVRIQRRGDDDGMDEVVFDMSQTPGLNGNDHDIASEIGLRTDLEVSTLGDPIPPGTFPGVGDVSTAGSFSLDYDYKAYYQEGPSILEEDTAGYGGDSLSNLLLPADDDTFEAQYGAEEHFEVLAPAGVLGLILETNKDGVPTINNIKPSSVLADQVRIGDRLLSVDGIDVSVMLASDVSRLIASKKDAPTRKFVFSRPAKRRDSVGEDTE